MSAADIPSVPASILKRKKDISKAVDVTSRHTIDTNVNPGGTATRSIVKRKTPSTKALVTVPVLPENRFAHTGKVYEHEDRIADKGAYRAGWNKYEREHPEELNEINSDADRYENQANTLSKYAFNRHPGNENVLNDEMRSNIKNRKKQKRGTGTWYPDNKPIYDAKYSEIVDEDVHESSKFRKAPSKDARNLGIAKKSKSVEPPGIKAISKRKEMIKSELLNLNPAKPSKKARKDIDDNWLIDKAFDKLVDVGKTAGEVVKTTGKVGKTVVKEGFHGAKKGIRAINEISDEVVKNPMLIRMGQAHEATLHGMASKRRHALGSIAAVGNNRRYVTAGSLVAQKGFVAHNNATIAPQTATRLRVIPKIVHRKNGDNVLYFLENGRQVSRAQARLIQEGILPPALANNASTTTEQTYTRDNTGEIIQKPAKTTSGLVRRNRSGSVNQTKIASPSGLIRKTHSEVV